MNSTEVEEFLEIEFNKPQNHTHHCPEEVKNHIISLGGKYKYSLGSNIKLILKLLKIGFKDIPKGKYKDCNIDCKIVQGPTFSLGCCKDHSIKITNLSKYGVENVYQSEIIKDRIKKQNIPPPTPIAIAIEVP